MFDKKIIIFGLVGTVGFIVDAFLLTFLTINLDFTLFSARLVSFTSATFVTWVLNKSFTFPQRKKVNSSERNKRYFFYLFVQTIGALLNFLVFFTLIKFNPFLKDMPVVPLAIGATVGLVFNFFMSKKFVFVDRGMLNE